MATSNNIKPASIVKKDLAKSAQGGRRGVSQYTNLLQQTQTGSNIPLVLCRNLYEANIDLSGIETGDGITNEINDIVLVTGQTDLTENGIYIVQSGAWTRYGTLLSGMLVLLKEGTLYANNIYVLTEPESVPVIGTDDIVFLNYRFILGISGNLINRQPLRAVQGLKFGGRSYDIITNYFAFLGNDDNFYRIDTSGTLSSGIAVGNSSQGGVMLTNGNNIVFGSGGGASSVRRYSTNGGTTWATATNSTVTAVNTGAINTNTGSAIMTYNNSNTNISRSTDNGATWSDLSVGSAAIYSRIANNNAASSAVWIVSNTTGSARISTDDGATWAAVTLPTSSVTALNFVNGYFMIVDSSNGKLYYSTTGGTGTYSSMNFISSTAENVIYFNSKYYTRIGSSIYSFDLNDEDSFRYENINLIGGGYPLIEFNSKIYTFSTGSMIFELS